MINLIVVASVAILAILAYYKGARILLTATVSFYPASMMYAALPIKEKVLLLGKTGNSLFYSHALIYGILFLLVFYAVYKITQHESLGLGVNRLINSILIGGAFTLLVVAICFHVLPSYNIYQLTNDDIKGFWNSDWGYFVALFAPLIAMWRVTKI